MVLNRPLVPSRLSAAFAHTGSRPHTPHAVGAGCNRCVPALPRAGCEVAGSASWAGPAPHPSLTRRRAAAACVERLGDAPRRFYYISESNSVQSGIKGVDYYDHLRAHIKLNGGSIYATEADAQAWADFDKRCRGGGHD